MARPGAQKWPGKDQWESHAYSQLWMCLEPLPNAVKVRDPGLGRAQRPGGRPPNRWPCRGQPWSWAPLTQRPFAPLMPGEPRDPGGPCGEEKEFGVASSLGETATLRARRMGPSLACHPHTSAAQEWLLPRPSSFPIEGLGLMDKSDPLEEAPSKLQR